MTMLEQRILKELKPHANKERAAHDVSYMKTQYNILGCNMPSIRATAKKFADTPSNELTKLWEASNSFDAMYVALIVYGNRELTLSDWKTLKRWSKRIDNWAHSDTLSEMISRLVESHPSTLYPELKAWNTSKLPWQRRLSLTSLLYYSALRSCYLPASKILHLVKARLKDEDIYVQKAVGWTLREAGNCYPSVVKKFIKKHILVLSPIAFTSATEKWTKAEKEPQKKKRKEARKRS